MVDADIIMATFVKILNEEGTSERVSFREIARRIGCNHTNLYNYFKNLDDLRNRCLIQVAQNLRKKLVPHDSSQPPDTELSRFVFSLVEWANSHPGIYRFLWLDSVSTDAVESVFSVLPRPEYTITPLLERMAAKPISSKKINQIAVILHSFVHGEIAKSLCLRNLTATALLAKRVSDDALFLSKSLLLLI